MEVESRRGGRYGPRAMIFLVKTILFLVAAGTLSGAGWWVYVRLQPPAYTLVTVTRGPVGSEVLATGNLEAPTTSDLYFKTIGKLAALNVHTGESVAAGTILARQNSRLFDAQFAQAEAAIKAATANLNEVRSGATPQTVAVSRAQVTVAQQSLNNAYATVPSTLADAYAKATDAVTTQLARFFLNGQTANPQLAFTLGNGILQTVLLADRASVNDALATWAKESAALTFSESSSKYNAVLAQAAAHLSVVQKLMSDAVAAVAGNTGLSGTDAADYRAAASMGLSETNAAIAEVRTLSNNIGSAEALLAQAESQLSLTAASSTVNNVAAAEAAVQEADANAAAISAQARDLEIIAPFDGVITDTHGSVGEVVGPGTTVVSLIPKAPLEIKANVSEDNIVGVAVGDMVRIDLDAFPNTTNFYGTVSQIDPAGTTISGSVYYKTTILLATSSPSMRPGMTANVWIETASSTDALLVPASALQMNGTSTTVEIFRQGKPVYQPIETGIVGGNGMVQVIAGVSEGDQIAIPK